MQVPHSATAAHLENVSKDLLLLCGQRRGELDVVSDDEIAPLARFLRDGHAEGGVDVLGSGLRRTGLVEADLLAVDGDDGALPTSEGLLQVEVDGHNEVVTISGIEGVGLLQRGC